MRAGLRPGDDASDYSEHPDIYEPPPATIFAQIKRTGYLGQEEGGVSDKGRCGVWRDLAEL